MKKYNVFRFNSKYGLSVEFKFSSDSKEDAIQYAAIMNRNKKDDEDERCIYKVMIALED